MKKYFFVFFLFLSLVSCKNETQIHEFKMVDNGWKKFENLKFTQGKFITDKAYSMKINLTIDKNYLEQNFDFQMLLESEEGESWNKSFSIPIKDDDGEFIEEEKNGLMNYQVLLLKTKYFHEEGNYKFEVVNLNHRIITQGIKDISFIIE